MVMPKRNKRKRSEETEEWGQKLSKRDFAISNKICAWNSQALNIHFFSEIIGDKDVLRHLHLFKIEFVEQQRSEDHVSASTWLFLKDEALETFKKILENFLEGSETEEVELLESPPLLIDNEEALWGLGKKKRNSEYGNFPILSSLIRENTQGQVELVINLRRLSWFYWDVAINYEIASTILSQILLDETCSVSFNNF
jgi:hypothetical protein